MLWTEKLGNEIVGAFSVPESVKMTSAQCVEFLTNHSLPWYKGKNHAFWNKIIFMQDNTPACAVKKTPLTLWFAMGIKGEKNHSVHHHLLTSILSSTCGAFLK